MLVALDIYTCLHGVCTLHNIQNMYMHSGAKESKFFLFLSLYISLITNIYQRIVEKTWIYKFRISWSSFYCHHIFSNIQFLCFFTLAVTFFIIMVKLVFRSHLTKKEEINALHTCNLSWCALETQLLMLPSICQSNFKISLQG